MQLRLNPSNNSFSDQLKQHYDEADIAYILKSADKEIFKTYIT